MPSFTTRRHVAFTPEQMFDLVADVETYPQFVPLCEGLTVKSRERLGASEVLVADMAVGYKALRETFTSRVRLDRTALNVHAESLAGPFRTMQNRWQFHPTAEGCEVEFFIAYEFKSLMLQMLVGAMFERAFRRFTEAFEARAEVVYGRAQGAATRPA